jgi:ribosomal protein S18 acetylase RimI-like enzyme
MNEDVRDLLRRIRETLVASTVPSRQCHRVGPFLAMLSPDNEIPWLNGAALVGDLPADPSADLEALEAYFAANHRSPRFEFFPDHTPELEAWLIGRGYERQHVLPTMVCTRETFHPVDREGVQIERLGPGSDLAGAYRAAAEAFEMEGDASPDELRKDGEAIVAGRLRRTLARIEGEIAGVASTVGDASVCELCGVGTRPAFRRRGVASVVSTDLMRAQFENPEAIVWLSAGDDTARQVYERLGFREIGVEVTYARPA